MVVVFFKFSVLILGFLVFGFWFLIFEFLMFGFDFSAVGKMNMALSMEEIWKLPRDGS